jgi:hypothetical protein
LPPVANDNPILDSPFKELSRHFKSDEDGLTSEIAEGRRRSTYFIPIAIFLAEVAGNRQPWIQNELREDDLARNSGLARIAFKMATRSGKTAVMAMLMAWQALNKLSDPHADQFANGRSGSASRLAAVPRDQVRPAGNLTA